MLLLTLRGTPTLYYGDEIGMRQVAIPPEPCAIRPRTAGMYPAATAPHADAMGRKRLCRILDGRALASAGRGFRRQQCRAPARRSGLALNLYRRLIALRRVAAGSDAGSLSAARRPRRRFGLHAGGGGRPGPGRAEFRRRGGRLALPGGPEPSCSRRTPVATAKKCAHSLALGPTTGPSSRLPPDRARPAANQPEPSIFQPFRLDLRESRRYIRDTLRQAVSFACSERPPG